jgi:hypothetical protein
MEPKRLRGRDLDVEEGGVIAERSVGEKVIPPRIVLGCRHVIRHDVEKYLEFVGTCRSDEPRPRSLAPQIVADSAGIGDVIAMLASRHRLQARRQVDVADAEVGEVR